MTAIHLLKSLNKFWSLLGNEISRITSPIILGLIFFLLITPVAFAGRLFGRDELRLSKSNATSYWIEKEQLGLSMQSFKNQF
jgi:hypothetical protein